MSPSGLPGSSTPFIVPSIKRNTRSPDTAMRDINDLLARGVLQKMDAGGRSTSYVLDEHPTGIAPLPLDGA